MDLYIFNLINQYAGRWAWLDFLGVFFAQYLEYVLLFILFLLLIIEFNKYFRIVFFYNRKLGIFFYISSFLIGLGRVFVGIHWPSDILIGAITGALVGVIFHYIFRKFARNN